MNSFFSLLFYFLVGLIIFSAITWIGFKIPPNPRKPDIIPGNPTFPLEGFSKKIISQPAQDDLLGTTNHCIAWGNGRMVVGTLPVFGRLWSAFSWVLYLDPGNSFVLRNRITWFGRSILLGGDLYSDGIGKFLMADTSLENENITQSEYTMLWIYSFAFGLDFLQSLPVSKQVANGDNYQLWTIGKENDRPIIFKLLYSPGLHTLLKIETNRTTSKSGKDLPFSIDFTQHLAPTLTKIIPGKITAAWEGESYMILNIKGFSSGLDISAEITKGI